MKAFFVGVFCCLMLPTLLPAASVEPAHDMGHLMTMLVLQLAVIVVAARVFGLIFSRYLKQSRVLGELVAG